MTSPLAIAVKTLCDIVTEANCDELHMEIGVHQGRYDGAVFTVHVVRRTLKEQLEREEELD